MGHRRASKLGALAAGEVLGTPRSDKQGAALARSRQTHTLPPLRPPYGWFTKGFDTLDLKEAKALLNALEFRHRLQSERSGSGTAAR